MAAMDEITSYLADVEAALISSPAIADFEVVRSWANTDDGYIRVQATLANGDFLEASEYFAFQGGYLVTVDYRYQWMDAEQTRLRRRWDSTPHHPELENFPHHVRGVDEENVIAGRPMSLIQLLAVLEAELSPELHELPEG